ncbi:MAG: carbohydrate ABC transporter permease [Oscillospiraceae bacterium]|nr:carbohydrate ABC transporter permease [Oscillospiraceae bacterium]MDD4367548.1 carbohydrate ABC transporter permease [Oscillospiraceae bacterium]
MKQHDSSMVAIKTISYIFIGLFAIFCLIPFLMMVSGSFSSEEVIITKGLWILPRQFSTEAYKLAFSSPKLLLGSYALTIILTVCGTSIGLFLISMTGYALQRRDFFLRNKISFFIYFTTLFSGGLAPTYLWMTKYLHLKDNYLAVFLPLLMSPWLIFLMKNFIKSIPFEITESGKIDGAGDFRIFVSLILPTLKPALATVGLFLALSYWNEWYNAMLYLSNKSYYPLQYFLYRIINMANYLKQSTAGAQVTVGNLPSNTLKMATAVLATGPIVFLYPFVQKYFISGMTIGAVKG